MFYHVSYLVEAAPNLYGLRPIQGPNFRVANNPLTSSHKPRLGDATPG